LKYVALVLLALLLCTAVFSGATRVGEPSIREARRLAEELLLPLEGVVGVSHREDPPRIVVYIEHERYRDRIPEAVGGFKVEVVVVGRVKALSLVQLEESVTPYYSYDHPVSRVGKVRPVVGGISIGVPEKDFGGRMAGTLGLVVRGPEGNYYILSNAHVIAMDSKARFLPLGTAVLQPGTYDGGTAEDRVGELYKYVKIVFGPRGRNYVDAAIALITIPEHLVGEVLGEDDQSTYNISGITDDVRVNDAVRKSGRTTGVTTESPVL